jgi:hypothetical protein
MSAVITTTISQAPRTIGRPEVRDGTIDHAGAGTIPAGTILGTLTATGHFVPYDSGAITGEETPSAILLQDSTASGAGSLPIRPMVGGQVAADQISIFGGGTITPQLRDALSEAGIEVVDVA